MDGQISGTNENQINDSQVDPWEAAFAAIGSIGKEDVEATATTGEPGTIDNGAKADDGDEKLSDNAEAGDNAEPAGNAGELGAATGSDDQEDQESHGGLFDFSGESVEQYEDKVKSDIRTQAINDIANEFIKRGIRNTDGVLGATMDDEDICKRDEDGVPHFYNPETGQEFRGDNPRRQAQEWVDDYNKELARVFNNACAQYEKHLMDQAAPSIAVRKFAPKYEKLDDIRRGMFDDVVADYEIKDKDGKVIGYSCDLDKALALVDRQISRIQEYAKQRQGTQQQQPTGPVLDMKTSSGAVSHGDINPPTSLAEAMERLQDRELEKMKR